MNYMTFDLDICKLVHLDTIKIIFEGQGQGQTSISQ